MKRGQVYILAVIILAFVIYTLYTNTNTVKEAIVEDDFEQLALNYQRESAKLINYLLANDINDQNDIKEHFTDFTTTFTAYSKTKNPNFGLLYLFDYKNTLYIGNYLEEPATITSGTSHIDNIPGCLRIIPAGFRLAGAVVGVGVEEQNIQNIDNNRCIRALSNSGNDYTYPVTITITEEDGSTSNYEASITKGKPDIVIVSRETKDNTRKVYTKGKFMNNINLDYQP
ncbi:MAG: hypothetical protein Q7R56_01415 [Nanoarchaeota archaeon]|nr:hypothetical protein [Nanoarchaeota archaeon]